MYIKKKDAATTAVGAKTVYKVLGTYISWVEIVGFIWVQDCYKKVIPIN